VSRKCFELAEQATATTGRRATHRLVGRRVNAPATFRGRSTGALSVRISRVRAVLARMVARVFPHCPLSRARFRVIALSAIRYHQCHRRRVEPPRFGGATHEGSSRARETSPVSRNAATPRPNPHCVRLPPMCAYIPLRQSRRSSANVRLFLSVAPSPFPPRRERTVFASGVPSVLLRGCVWVHASASVCLRVCRAWLSGGVNVRICFGNVTYITSVLDFLAPSSSSRLFPCLSCHVSRGQLSPRMHACVGACLGIKNPFSTGGPERVFRLPSASCDDGVRPETPGIPASIMIPGSNDVR